MTLWTLIPGGAFGDRVRRRLTDEKAIWLTTVGLDGTPQPNPVGFLWDGADSVLIYSQHGARRLANIGAQPRVALHFDGHGGTDVVVLTGSAELGQDVPPVSENPAWLRKYGDDIDVRFGSVDAFARRFSVPVRIRLDRVRGS